MQNISHALSLSLSLMCLNVYAKLSEIIARQSHSREFCTCYAPVYCAGYLHIPRENQDH